MTARLTRVGADVETVRVVEPEIVPRIAVIVAWPAARACASPAEVIVATVVGAALQVTCVVRSWVEPSEYVPVAANCWLPSGASVGLAGVTDMLISAGVTVRVAEPVVEAKVAEMLADPIATA